MTTLNEADSNFTEEEEFTFSEIYAAVVLNSEVVITILKEEVERVKTGLKNLKAKQASRMKEDGLVPDPSIFAFTEHIPLDESFDKELYTDLSISLTRKSTVKVSKLRIPENNF